MLDFAPYNALKASENKCVKFGMLKQTKKHLNALKFSKQIAYLHTLTQFETTVPGTQGYPVESLSSF